MTNGYMVDTNVFNWLLDGRISLLDLPEGPRFITHVQSDELRATKNPVRRDELLTQLNVVRTGVAPTEAFVWGTSAWGESKWGSGPKFNLMFAALRSIDQKPATDKTKQNQLRDILIAETALETGLVLITADQNLARVMRDFGGTAIQLDVSE